MPDPHTLTARQLQVYRLLWDGARRGVQPTVREIGQAIGVTSPNGVMVHLRALEKKGWIAPSDGTRTRSRVLLRTPDGQPLADAAAHQYVAIVSHPTKGERVFGPVASRAEAEALVGRLCRAELGSWGGWRNWRHPSR